jgi:membrane fusion protein (multidrug efflux system)
MHAVLGASTMIRLLLCLAVVCVVLSQQSDRAAAEVKGSALVQVADPKRGAIPDLVVGHGVVESDNTLTRSFQRDGQVSEIMVEVGDQFKKGDPLLNFGASPAAVVAYEQAKTTLRLAQGTRDRTKRMVNLKLATIDQLETAEKAVSDAQLTKEMYEKQGSTTSEILEAPFDGVVMAISVSKGDRVAAGAPLMTLAETDKLRLGVGIEPSEIGKVRPGQPVTLVSLLMGKKSMSAKVKSVGAAIDPKTREVPAFIDLSKENVIPGENFTAEIQTGSFEGWIISRDAVGIDKKGPFIFQVDDEHAKRVNVNVLGSAGENSIIEGDIDPEKKIVVTGGYQIADGDALRSEEVPSVAATGSDQDVAALRRGTRNE